MTILQLALTHKLARQEEQAGALLIKGAELVKQIVGLTRAFIYAGTPSVITTLWKVDDRASYELMREFHANLKTMTKSEALRQAQVKTMREFPEPFFWAAYQLTGES